MPDDVAPTRLIADPERIDCGNFCVATLDRGRRYLVGFPFSPEAVGRIKQISGANWCPTTRSWSVSSSRAAQLEAALRDIAAMPDVAQKAAKARVAAVRPKRSDPDGPPLEKIVVAVAAGVKPGDVLDTKKGPRVVESLGVSFRGPAWLGKQGRRELVGERVCYAWSRPETEAELAARSESRVDAEAASPENPDEPAPTP
jgi:hypothetical protein